MGISHSIQIMFFQNEFPYTKSNQILQLHYKEKKNNFTSGKGLLAFGPGGHSIRGNKNIQWKAL